MEGQPHCPFLLLAFLLLVKVLGPHFVALKGLLLADSGDPMGCCFAIVLALLLTFLSQEGDCGLGVGGSE